MRWRRERTGPRKPPRTVHYRRPESNAQVSAMPSRSDDISGRSSTTSSPRSRFAHWPRSAPLTCGCSTDISCRLLLTRMSYSQVRALTFWCRLSSRSIPVNSRSCAPRIVTSSFCVRGWDNGTCTNPNPQISCRWPVFDLEFAVSQRIAGYLGSANWVLVVDIRCGQRQGIDHCRTVGPVRSRYRCSGVRDVGAGVCDRTGRQCAPVSVRWPTWMWRCRGCGRGPESSAIALVASARSTGKAARRLG